MLALPLFEQGFALRVLLETSVYKKHCCHITNCNLPGECDIIALVRGMPLQPFASTLESGVLP